MATSSVEPAAPAGSRAGPAGYSFVDLSGNEPIRGELYGLEHLAARARALAEFSAVVPGPSAGHPLLRRFVENGRRLLYAYQQISQAVRLQETITPDAEWLLDNFHIISDTLEEIRHDLPRGYYRELPKLAATPLAGLPRVYLIALELLAHTDSALDETNIMRFVQAYQSVSPLTIGELWAVPIMLRLGLLENLRRLAEQMLEAWGHRRQAELCSARLVAIEERGPQASRLHPLSTLLDPETRWADAFIVRLMQTLREHGPEAAWLAEWLERHYTSCGQPPAEVLRREHQRQAANQVSVGNCVTSLRLVSSLDWTVVFERLSLVEAVLREDPAGVYPRQDFPTKDRYRREVEKLARGSGQEELAVARQVVTLAQSGQQAGSPSSRSSTATAMLPAAPAAHPAGATQRHVGFYLIGPGRRELETIVRYRSKPKDWLLDKVLSHPNAVYFGSLALTYALFLAWLGAMIQLLGWGWASMVLLLAALVPVSDLAVGTVHYLVTLFLPPRVLPKLDFKEGIPAECATFVVMPTMLLQPESAAALAERLEVHYLSNPDPQLRFALLTDFADAPAETRPEDEHYLQSALEHIRILNERYAAGGPDRFFLFQRRRIWNPVQGCWMGWERKRGKLDEFNRLLRGARDTTFAWTNADLERLPFIRYVITLDVDTQLPREAAPKLIGTLDHVLNRPRFDAERGLVVEGYGVLQPRVSLSLLATVRSLFSRIFAASAGIDPYTTAVSDVYQDLFGRGSFTGKGIYDVDAFAAATGQTFPQNTILSHDLIEGNYARCGLVTDIELLDDFPARYHAYARREHRWVRGDWQLLPWLFPMVPAPAQQGASGQAGGAARIVRRRNPLPALERWKIFDNLRRSLVPPALLVLFALGWILPDGPAWFWTALAVLITALPLVLLVPAAVSNLLHGGSLWLRLRAVRETLEATAEQVLLKFIFLAEQARLFLDAIVRTLVRLTITHRNLLEWETAASTEQRLGAGFVQFCLTMWPTPLLAIAIGLVVWLARPAALPVAGPVLFAWFISPAVAFWVSRPLRAAEVPLDAQERREVGRIARKTWSFFETFVSQADHWLPPDNYQEDPKGAVAHRTSPTNMGLYLVSSLAAHDFGYLSLSALLDRLEKTFETLDQLERFRGHFYNWYDTTTLRPLQPGYVSTVDSGNLLGSLLTLKQGLRHKIEEGIPGPSMISGLIDTLGLVAEEVRVMEPPALPEPLDAFRTLEQKIAQIERQLAVEAHDLCAWSEWLHKLDEEAAQLLTLAQALADTLHETPEDLLRWAHGFANQVRDHRDELARLMPWLELSQEVPGTTPPPQGDASGNGRPVVQQDSEVWKRLRGRLTSACSLADLQMQTEAVLEELGTLPGEKQAAERTSSGLQVLSSMLQNGSAGSALLNRCQRLADRAAALAGDMDFKMLYNELRHLFSIGYNLTTNRLDNTHYDLLASEACLTSFLAIARGDAPKRHWFHLGRPLTRVGGGVALLSWGGTMFEYLMPRLFLRAFPESLLDESSRSAVRRQIEYGRERQVPWGISESAFSALDAALDYQYQSFGVPGLGLKRGLGQNLVVAPYATALALPLVPREALENFRRLRAEGAEGRYGFYESIDYTRQRLPDQRRAVVVRCFMAHHQGMSLAAMANCLFGELLVRRFHSEPAVRATELLLQERVPRAAPLHEARDDTAPEESVVRERVYPMSRRVTTPHTPHPRTHLLSNGRYHVMVTNAGSGYSSWLDLDVTRWREDRTRDCWGQFLYVRDLRSGLVWSAGYHPLCRVADEYEVVYSSDKAEFRRFDDGIETHLEIAVSPENAAEVRRLTITNHNPRTHDIELTSYAELVLNPRAADQAHPAFGKLFLETEYVEAVSALLCRRRPRSPEQKPLWAVHVLAVDGPLIGPTQYETDRARFLGRGRSPSDPAALERGTALSGTTGAVLDPVFSLRRRVRVVPRGSVVAVFTTAIADSREQALVLADQYHGIQGVTRTFELAWAYSQVQLRDLRLSAEETHLYQRLASQIIYAGSSLRVPGALTANRQGQQALWRYGISGDLPIVLVRIADMGEVALVGQLLLAHTYLRLKGLAVDLVVLNEHAATYLEELHEQLQALVRASDAHALMDKPGGVFVRKASQMTEEDKVLLQAAARVVLVGAHGSLASQVDRAERPVPLPGRLSVIEPKRAPEKADAEQGRGARPSLLFDNGFGGFATDGREYCVLPYDSAPTPAAASDDIPGAGRPHVPGKDVLVPSLRLPPAPWINVVANPLAGFLISEAGLGYTWTGNSQTNRLTPWNNDPVSDPPGEAVYVRDEATGEFWSPTPLPLRFPAPTQVRHGQGYTIYEQQSHGLAHELLTFVPPSDPVKLVRLKVHNTGRRNRRLSVTFYLEWVLGTVRAVTAPTIVPWVDPQTGALLARNAFNLDFATSIAFVDVNLRPRTLTADRTEFLGRNGSAAAPAALSRVELSGRAEPALDPCAAVMAKFELKPGETREVIFVLGESGTQEDVHRLLDRYREAAQVQQSFDEVCARWDHVLNAVQVRSPNQALDLLLNRWLLYQVLGCRLWARSAFYQSGGAYGFRDQLQDVMALATSAAEEQRAQLLRAAGRQFLEGDVQHWWHPPSGRGVRTRISDDYLWLPFVACQYVATTGDAGILDAQAPFLRAPLLRPDQEEDYGLPEVTAETATLYEHCVRAVEHGLRFGSHGLPLMGTGDWNDGMNRVGSGGRGESVWLGWFLLTVLQRFAPVAEARGEAERAARYRKIAEELSQAIEQHAWDGRWYRRAYFDDGTPLGSELNDECKIDSMPQSWAVIACAAPAERAEQALAAVNEFLVERAGALILLFTPPFDRGPLQPGYIKGYVPGIRENGGQYTHGSTWVVQAAALLGKGGLAMELFDILNPIHHASSPEKVERYKVEPYVAPADVYSNPQHIGRGGWTWYTGSAGWLYRIGIENILGIRHEGTKLRIDPCIPAGWRNYEVTYRAGSTIYHIIVENPHGLERGVVKLSLDSLAQPGNFIELADDGQTHEVRVLLEK
jgi:cyclic beta-1,2-glucan synthetase